MHFVDNIELTRGILVSLDSVAWISDRTLLTINCFPETDCLVGYYE